MVVGLKALKMRIVAPERGISVLVRRRRSPAALEARFPRMPAARLLPSPVRKPVTTPLPLLLCTRESSLVTTFFIPGSVGSVGATVFVVLPPFCEQPTNASDAAHAAATSALPTNRDPRPADFPLLEPKKSFIADFSICVFLERIPSRRPRGF